VVFNFNYYTGRISFKFKLTLNAFMQEWCIEDGIERLRSTGAIPPGEGFSM
jgi:hypothetical protein